VRLLTIPVAVLSASTLFSACAPSAAPPTPPYVTTYYDRNRDGVVDFELHRAPGWADADWSYCDVDFDTRYDFKIRYSAGVVRKHVSLNVPRDVPLTPGKPPVFKIP
jgi:hypothetical protein